MTKPEAIPEDWLSAEGLVSADQLRIARHELQGNREQSLGDVLLRLGFVSAAAWRDAKAQHLGQAGIDLLQNTPDAAAIALLPKALAKRLHVVPLSVEKKGGQLFLVLAVAKGNDLLAEDEIRQHLLKQHAHHCQITTRLALLPDIEEAIDRHYGYALAIDDILHEIESSLGTAKSAGLEAAAADPRQPIVRLIDALLVDAVKAGASDIHFEPEQGFLRIRYRIDGLLHGIRALHPAYWQAMVVRIKVLAGMNITETRAPQDGRISLEIGGRPVDFRVSSQPTLHGENLVLRILDRSKGIVPLADLGLPLLQQQQLKRLLARPEGILLVTGPTGSGKTTTLYSLLAHLRHENINIMTLEDPVEYPMALLRQTSVNEASKLDFAGGIRAMLRQDPDVILVGEIRDKDTADMAFRAAMTGHQVFATLHSNSAIGALPRLRDIGLLPEIIGSNLIGIIAQRLLRRLCNHCKEAYAIKPEDRALFGENIPSGQMLYRPVGCEKCRMQGYRGRLAIMELLRVDLRMADLISQSASFQEIATHAAGRGFLTLADDGIARLLLGETSIAELCRVVDMSERLP